MTTQHIIVQPGGGVVLAPSERVILPQTSFHVSDRPIATAFGRVVPAPLSDLVDIAMAAYLADRLVLRPTDRGEKFALRWHRRFVVQMPVRHIELWSNNRMAELLTSALAYFTDDEWHFEFRKCAPGARPAETEGHLFETPPQGPVRCALFSGGLDSLAGLASEMAEEKYATFVLFGASTTNRIAHVQRQLIAGLRELAEPPVVSVIVPFGFHRKGLPYSGDERSQRSRGFVFGCLGAITAHLAGTNRLAVYENGIGAINLPYTGAQLGAHSTRAAHPSALAALSLLLSGVFGVPFTVELPFLNETKGQICSRLKPEVANKLIGATVSCDGYPQRLKHVTQCGTCTSCILRRQALRAAGWSKLDPASQYKYDLFSDVAPAEERHRLPFKAMMSQVYALRKLVDAPEPWAALCAAYPTLLEIVDLQAGPIFVPPSRAGLVNLYRNYVEEWDRLAHLPWTQPWLA